MAQLYVFMST